MNQNARWNSEKKYNFTILKHIFDNRTLHVAALNDKLHLYQLCSITDKWA